MLPHIARQVKRRHDRLASPRPFTESRVVCRCAYEILKRRDKKKKRLCPDCHKSVSSRLYLHCEDPHGMNTLNHSSLSLASLRASSLATLDDCHATSSV